MIEVQFEDQAYKINQVRDDPRWAVEMLNTFYAENRELRRYLDIARVRSEQHIPDDLPDDYIQDWFGHPDFGRH